MNIKSLLDSYYHKYNSQLSSNDPIWNLRFAKSDSDKELLAFFISCYAYGNIAQINKHIKKFIDIAEGNIYKFIEDFKSLTHVSLLKKKSQKESYYYRFNTEQDFMDLLLSLQIILKKYGCLKSLFLKHYSNSHETILPALNKFTFEIRNSVKHSRTFEYLIPDVSKNSTCKRLNLFLRWMVRKDSIDTGLWSMEVDKSKLIIPVDTHVYNVSQKLGLVQRKSCDIKYAIELTEKLKTYDQFDPVKYDFALCHIGVDKVKIISD